MLSVKQRGLKYHFLNLWYDSTWDWTQVSRAIGEHSNHYPIKVTKIFTWCYYCLLWIKLVNTFTYLGSSVASTEKDIDTRLTKAWTAINWLSIIWKSDLTDKMKRSFFQVAVASILLYGCTTCTLTKRLEKKLDGNYTRMLRAILNKSWRQHTSRHQLYRHLPPITKTIQVRRTRHAGHCWRSRDELISDVLLWTPTHGRAKAGRPAWTYILQLCEYTGCSPEDLPEAMNDREKCRERVRDIRATSTTWWWWWWWLLLLLVTWNLIPVGKQMITIHLFVCFYVSLDIFLFCNLFISNFLERWNGLLKPYNYVCLSKSSTASLPRDPTPSNLDMSVLDMTLNNLMVRFQ